MLVMIMITESLWLKHSKHFVLSLFKFPNPLFIHRINLQAVILQNKQGEKITLQIITHDKLH